MFYEGKSMMQLVGLMLNNLYNIVNIVSLVVSFKLISYLSAILELYQGDFLILSFYFLGVSLNFKDEFPLFDDHGLD